ncbi:MAG: hypothetical protein J6R77_06295 [Clostridia bacterium]|nr:hypothetical protein [Clostridia bacterium]
MRILSRICSVLSWVFLVITTFLHLLLIFTLWMPPFFSGMFGRVPTENPVNKQALPFVVVGFVLFLAGFFLFRFLRRWRWGWYVAMAVGAILLAGAGLYLKVMYPETVVGENIYSGYNSAFKLVWRHMLPIGIMVLQLFVGIFRQKAEDKELYNEAIKEIKKKGVKPRFE